MLENQLGSDDEIHGAVVLSSVSFFLSTQRTNCICSFNDSNYIFNLVNKWQADNYCKRAALFVGAIAEGIESKVGLLQAKNKQALDLIRSGIHGCLLNSLQLPMLPRNLRLKKVCDPKLTSSNDAISFIFESASTNPTSSYVTAKFEHNQRKEAIFSLQIQGKDQFDVHPLFVVCGYVSSSEATLFLEGNKSGYVEITCFDGLTGREHTVCKFVQSGIPSKFCFLNLCVAAVLS